MRSRFVPDAPLPKMRSWLFAPGDSVHKMTKAIAGPADIVLLDLEDSVVQAGKAAARTMVRDRLMTHADGRARLWVRVNPLAGPDLLDDLVAIMPARPGGIMLPKAGGRRDMERLDDYLTALEVANGIARGTTPVIPLVTETAASMFQTGDYKGAPRLAAMTWGAEDLADALGASVNSDANGHYGFTYQLARSLCLLGAAAAGVPAIETIHGDFRDVEGLKRRAEQVRRDGYAGMLAIHPAQVEVINAAFTPSPEEVAQAQAIVDLFAAHPGVGTIGHGERMLDRPHLSRALQIVDRASRDH